MMQGEAGPGRAWQGFLSMNGKGSNFLRCAAWMGRAKCGGVGSGLAWFGKEP